MRSTSTETLAASVWGLNFTSYIMQSMPYLQAASLILAIAVSLFTLRQLVRDSNKNRPKDKEQFFIKKKVNISSLGLARTANTFTKQLEQVEKLKKVFLRSNYPAKLKSLYTKVESEYTFWNTKANTHPEKLADLKKDLNFIKVQETLTEYDKIKIDLLVVKYGLN